MSRIMTDKELDLIMNKAQVNSIQVYYNTLSRNISSKCIKSVGKPEHAGLLEMQKILDQHIKVIDEARSKNDKGELVNVDSMLNKMNSEYPTQKLNEVA